MRKIVLIAASAALVAGAGCSAIGRQAFQQPIVTLRNVQVQGLGLTGGNLDVVLNVYNPNNYRLDATRMTYKVLVGDTVSLGTGALDSRFTVQNKDSSQVHIPLSFTYAGIGAAGQQLLNTGAVNYKVLGDVTVGSPLGNYTIPFTSTGRFTTMGGTTH